MLFDAINAMHGGVGYIEFCFALVEGYVVIVLWFLVFQIEGDDQMCMMESEN